MNLVAEHGVWHKLNGSKKWERYVEIDNIWKEDFRSVMNTYVDRTPGSFLEEKDYSLVWHYRKVETGLGEIRTRELISHLKYISSEKDIQIMEGVMVIEVKKPIINKGIAANRWIQSEKYDFYLACGDDLTDEDTFSVMPKSAYTLKVNSGSTIARFRIENFSTLQKLLETLVNQ